MLDNVWKAAAEDEQIHTASASINIGIPLYWIGDTNILSLVYLFGS